ncbi:MAG: tetratricopeptide repeat protein [Alphaproteobacteria bacterium]|nr:tetratricopeptide repeat protein [Alphaproteobacteria bacterium]
MKKSNPSFAMMQKAVKFHQTGQIPEAERSYQEVLAADPLHIDALRLLGGLYVQWNKPESAISYLEKALGIQPDQPEILNSLGVALSGQGKFNDALMRYQRAVEIAPDYWDSINNMGNMFYASGKLDDAIIWLERSLQIRPDNAQTHGFLGHAFRAQKKDDQAIAHYRHALRLAPDNVEILTSLGNLLRNTGQSEEACVLYQRLAQLTPNDMNVHLNLGTIFHDRGQLPEATEQYEKVLRLQPDNTDAMINRASLLMELNRPEEARMGYEQSLSVNPQSPEARMGKSLALLMLGEYREGWELYESRFECNPMCQAMPFKTARWDGSPLAGKRLLIWGEQGLGDVLQFVRYAALCKERGGTVIVMCREPLVRLLKNCPFIDEVVTAATPSDFDYQIPMMSLPRIFGTTLDTVPQAIPYLYVSEEARAKWAPRFADAQGFKVGLVWAGNPRKNQIDAHVTDRQRSLSLALMKPLLDVADCQFYNLQKGEASSEIDANGLRARLIDYMPEVGDFMDTAVIVENLDLVISVDTSVVHLAGGLGKPVWVLSRYGGCWRWLQNRKKNPWYPTARIFGQPGPGDWESCVREIGYALDKSLSKGK